MNKLVSWSSEDEAVAATNTDATECKLGAVELGYWTDPYVRLFARRAERRAPEINRGYFARVRAVEIFIHQFLERCDSKCQVINLGCGFDTLFWRLRDVTQAVGNFIELDFPTVTAKKCQIIKRNKQLLEKITNEDGEVAIRAGDLHADGYHLAGCDLRELAGVKRALAACGARADAPTLVLAECVLVYLRPDAATRLLELLAAAFPKQLLVVYEQCSLDDKFGEVMIRNLALRGCGGGSVAARGRLTPSEAAARLRAAGYGAARGWPMAAVWRALPQHERARVERLEPLDEQELLQQLHQHYALTIASQGDLFADIDLNAYAPPPADQPV